MPVFFLFDFSNDNIPVCAHLTKTTYDNLHRFMTTYYHHHPPFLTTTTAGLPLSESFIFVSVTWRTWRPKQYLPFEVPVSWSCAPCFRRLSKPCFHYIWSYRMWAKNNTAILSSRPAAVGKSSIQSLITSTVTDLRKPRGCTCWRKTSKPRLVFHPQHPTSSTFLNTWQWLDLDDWQGTIWTYPDSEGPQLNPNQDRHPQAPSLLKVYPLTTARGSKLTL
jgi:hypothetical protein